jgi:hypothetical protein
MAAPQLGDGGPERGRKVTARIATSAKIMLGLPHNEEIKRFFGEDAESLNRRPAPEPSYFQRPVHRPLERAAIRVVGIDRV